MSDYPEHEKLQERKKELEWIQSFCRFLSSKRLLNQKKSYKDEYEDEQETCWALGDNEIAIIISEYFGIDPEKFEQEKVQMLEAIRKANEESK